MGNRLFLLYFPGFFDGDEIIGIYDDISKLKDSYERVMNNPADEDGFRYYDFYLNHPFTKLTIEEFVRDNEEFVEADPAALWAELEKEPAYGKGPFFHLVTAGEWNHDDDRWRGILFKELRQYLSRTVRLSVCFKDDGCYDNYLILSDIPEGKYDEMGCTYKFLVIFSAACRTADRF